MMTTVTLPAAGKPSKVETIKRASRNLRGSLAAGLADAGLSHFGEDDVQLIKMHGIYQGYDRDTATARKQQGLEKEFDFMIRAKIPAGRLTPDQYLALDALAGKYGNGNMRITTRQDIQYHGVIKRDLKTTVAEINQALLTTLGACGDVVRNVTATPAPIADAVHRRLQADADMLTAALLPKTRAYHEIWIDGAKLEDPADDPEDALYKDAYLPRKFKIGLATPDDNSIDVLTNDLAVIALFDGETPVGYNLAVGGGLGMTHNQPKTYPRLATPVAFVPPALLLAAVRAVIETWRDHGDRSDRKHARIKYLIQEMGTPWFKAEMERRIGQPLAVPREQPAFAVIDHMGWHAQKDGRWYLGLPIPSGRIQDGDKSKLRTGLRLVVERFRARPILTATQDIILADIAEVDRPWIDALLRQHAVTFAEDLTPVARWALACPARPSCGLALSEAERIRAPLVAAIEHALTRHGLRDERISLRITGCPNGCARPYVGDIGLVGRTPDDFAIYLGGDFEGTRLNRLVFERVPLDEVAATLESLFAEFAAVRRDKESFGDFCARLGPEALRA
ncbi:MAG TPA: NADPH-dependent assimilatory sulfite reductase hemoprotein subunit, partial [Candidatus Sulfotelmatobacter sp.]|nr:NADPH-dependent assimilatory sulfite reductase hemoprotein subunit [Candidatus Sulfotelmatobacter sp.]